jgi:hypothetical protein
VAQILHNDEQLAQSHLRLFSNLETLACLTLKSTIKQYEKSKKQASSNLIAGPS